MTMIEALELCVRGTTIGPERLCCRPISWRDSGNGQAYHLRKERTGDREVLVRLVDDPEYRPPFLPWAMLTEEWEVLRISDLRHEQIARETGYDGD